MNKEYMNQLTKKLGTYSGYTYQSKKAIDKKDNIEIIYQQWLKETKRSGGVLVGSSIREFFNYYKNYNNESIKDKQTTKKEAS